MRSELIIVLLLFAVSVQAQDSAIINVDEVSRIEKTLSSDKMQGRKTFSPGIDSAANFIADEFRKAGLLPANGNSFFQEFSLIRTKPLKVSGILDGAELDEGKVIVLTGKPSLALTQQSGYEKMRVTKNDTLFRIVQRLVDAGKNYFLLVDSVHVRDFNTLKRFNRESSPLKNSIVLVLSSKDASKYSVNFTQEISELKLKNVVGLLPGKEKKDEYVIFSAHYDHLGIGKPNKDMDSIYNGANDDASGTTAVIMLGKYFNTLKDNERSLVFAAFTAEEIGGYGSRHFSKQYDPAKVVAMFNIEMIGTESKWGTNSAFITGYEKSDMGTILKKNLEGSAFKFYPDPYPQQQLFYRSDNATLARLGVPAHTISTSKMDSEPYYHTQDDEFETLDMKNMAEIIKAIAISSKTIVSGKDTPTRVDTKQLR
jgi:Zn-dependent M28 family amino/carboxypeptidase